MTVGTTITRKDFPESPLRIKEIITHRLESGNRKVKIDNPIYIIEYLNSEKKDFTTYEKDITRNIEFKSWKI